MLNTTIAKALNSLLYDYKYNSVGPTATLTSAELIAEMTDTVTKVVEECRSLFQRGNVNDAKYLIYAYRQVYAVYTDVEAEKEYEDAGYSKNLVKVAYTSLQELDNLFSTRLPRMRTALEVEAAYEAAMSAVLSALNALTDEQTSFSDWSSSHFTDDLYERWVSDYYKPRLVVPESVLVRLPENDMHRRSIFIQALQQVVSNIMDLSSGT